MRLYVIIVAILVFVNYVIKSLFEYFEVTNLASTFYPIVNNIFKFLLLFSIPIYIICFLIYKYIKERLTKKHYKKHSAFSNIEQKFDDIYNKIKLKKIAKEKKSFNKYGCLAFIFFIIMVTLVIFIFIEFHDLLLNGTTPQKTLKMVFLIILFTISSIIHMTTFLKYLRTTNTEDNRTDNYNQLVTSFFNLAYPDINYSDVIEKHSDIFRMISHNYVLSNFDEKEVDKIHPEDLITLNNITDDPLHTAYLAIEHFDNVTSSYVCLFRGIYAFIHCKNIDANIVISTTKKDKFNYSNKIKLDSENFEKYYNVYSDDKILATRILTSDTMEYLTDFYNKYGIEFQLAITQDVIHIRFFTSDLFSYELIDEKKSKEKLYFSYVVIEFITSLTKKINATINILEI